MILRRVVVYTGLVTLLCSGLFASPIFVNNFSFESFTPPTTACANPAGACSFTVANVSPIPGWTASDPANEGQFKPGAPTNTTYYNSVPDGNWVAWANDGNLTQVVGAVTANWTYTLTVSLGLRTDLPNLGTAELLINGVPYVATGVAPTAGNWSPFTVVYNSALHPGDVGQPITIELISNGVQAGFDDVILNTPEPATLTFMGMGLLGLALAVRGRMRRSS